MHWFPIGLAIMTTHLVRSITPDFQARCSAGALRHTLYPGLHHGRLAITRIVMPFYYRIGLTSVYEYLEKRFDVRVRCLASGLFIIWRLFWMATTLYVPCKILSVITGLDLVTLILLTGASVMAYTVAGA